MTEKEISETEKKSKVVQITGKVTQETKDLFEELKDSGAYDTFGQFMDALLEHYQNPIKINKDYEAKIGELNRKVQNLEDQLKIREEEILGYIKQGDEKGREFESLKAEYADLSKMYSELSATSLEQATKIKNLDGIQHKMRGHILVPVSELDEMCLQYLTNRERSRRKRNDITPESFFMYAIRVTFIDGDRFAIPSVPDRKIEEFKKIIASKEHQDGGE